MIGNVAVISVVLGGDGTFHDTDKAIGIGNGLFQGLFRGFACGGHDGLVVVEGDGVENQGVQVRVNGAEQGFGTAGAFRFVQVDN